MDKGIPAKLSRTVHIFFRARASLPKADPIAVARVITAIASREILKLK
jgi:hypothetical protein